MTEEHIEWLAQRAIEGWRFILLAFILALLAVPLAIGIILSSIWRVLCKLTGWNPEFPEDMDGGW